MTDMINGYRLEDLNTQLFERFDQFTASAIEKKLDTLRMKLNNGSILKRIPISLGENCGAGVKIREARQDRLGAFFFDNLVAPFESVMGLFRTDFSELLNPRYLRIDQWETHDSVYDAKAQIFFHHYFHLRPVALEKSHPGPVRRRRIDAVDIPLFLPMVSAQFSYLIEKTRIVLRSDCPKRLIFRRVNGEWVSAEQMARLQDVLEGWGARNFELVNVYSKPKPNNVEDDPHHIYVAEQGARWGHVDNWAPVFS